MPKDWKAFAPRVGFAWDPKGDGKQSVRVGYSLGNDFVNGQFLHQHGQCAAVGSEVRLNGRQPSTIRSGRRRDEHLPGHLRQERGVLAQRSVSWCRRPT
jgi:hypothetical protein